MASHNLRIACVFLAGFCCLFLSSRSVGAPADQAKLKTLFDGRRWFELRDAVAETRSPPFYEGVVACAFNELVRCGKKLGSVIKSHPMPDVAFEAHKHLANVDLTHGRYREALAQVDAALAIKPDDSDSRGVLPLLAALAEFPDQRLVRNHHTTLQLHEDGLPLSIHGVSATYWFDTGAVRTSRIDLPQARLWIASCLPTNLPRQGRLCGREPYRDLSPTHWWAPPHKVSG